MAHPAPDTLALVALGEDASPDVLAHLGSCRTCFGEVEALQQVVAVGRSLGPEDRLEAPHPRVWQRIATDVNDGRVIPLPGAATLHGRAPVVPPGEPRDVPLGGVEGGAVSAGGPGGGADGSGRRPLRGRRWFTAALAAAALVVGLGGGYAIKSAVDPSPDVVSATQLNALPQWAGANGSAAVERGSDGQRTLVITMEMPPNEPVDGRLDVWMSDSRATDMLLMGSMNGMSGRFPIPASVELASHPIIDVSLEPMGDTDPTHSDTSVVRGRLKL